MSNESLTLSIRLIRSCEHRNLRFMPLQEVDCQWKTEQLMEAVKVQIQNSTSLPPPFKKFNFNCMKVRIYISYFYIDIGFQFYGTKILS